MSKEPPDWTCSGGQVGFNGQLSASTGRYLGKTSTNGKVKGNLHALVRRGGEEAVPLVRGQLVCQRRCPRRRREEHARPYQARELHRRLLLAGCVALVRVSHSNSELRSSLLAGR